MDTPKKSTRGFASMDPEKRRAIAAKGGKSVSAENRSFAKNRSLAAEAGRKGGKSVPPESRSFAKDPALAANAGKKGGMAAQGGRETRRLRVVAAQ
jgi:general stress protein YciG